MSYEWAGQVATDWPYRYTARIWQLRYDAFAVWALSGDGLGRRSLPW